MEVTMKTNFIITLVCMGIIIFHLIVSLSIILHPYMVGLNLTAFGIGGFNFGIGVGKLIKLNR